MHPTVFALIPAAGVGQRAATPMPKQYAQIAGQSMLAWSIRALLQPLQDAPKIAHVFVVTAPNDGYIDLALDGLGQLRPQVTVLRQGGQTRAQTVLNGLQHIQKLYGAATLKTAWALVHDAARPGLQTADLQRLVSTCVQANTGGLLAVPVADTVKSARSAREPAQHLEVQATVDRQKLWLAQTPQMYSFADLHVALTRAIEQNLPITDESSAIEAAGLPSMLIPGSASNFKVTYPQDFALMAQVLLAQQSPAQPSQLD